ncbi:ankyrin repeat domain-containing protein [Rickettsiales bacterium]|nr:ankyrin repeat domain-containing protein [Rickettsiales bacterium]
MREKNRPFEELVNLVWQKNYQALNIKLSQKSTIPLLQIFIPTTILNVAVQAGHIGIVNLLIQKGTNVDSQDLLGHCPLWWAVETKNIKILKLLIREGADLNQQDRLGQTPLSLAKQANNSDIIKLLLPHVTHDSNPLINALILRQTQLFDRLLRQNLDVSLKSSDGKSMLYLASEFGYNDIVKILINKGADVNESVQNQMQKNDNNLPLTIALTRGNVEVVKTLLKSGARPYPYQESLGIRTSVPSIVHDIFRFGLDKKDEFLMFYGYANGVKVCDSHGLDISSLFRNNCQNQDFQTLITSTQELLAKDKKGPFYGKIMEVIYHDLVNSKNLTKTIQDCQNTVQASLDFLNMAYQYEDVKSARSRNIGSNNFSRG